MPRNHFNHLFRVPHCKKYAYIVFHPSINQRQSWPRPCSIKPIYKLFYFPMLQTTNLGYLNDPQVSNNINVMYSYHL